MAVRRDALPRVHGYTRDLRDVGGKPANAIGRLDAFDHDERYRIEVATIDALPIVAMAGHDCDRQGRDDSSPI